jgi:hypothetical protein
VTIQSTLHISPVFPRLCIPWAFSYDGTVAYA